MATWTRMVAAKAEENGQIQDSLRSQRPQVLVVD